jgi:hypothetical protein
MYILKGTYTYVVYFIRKKPTTFRSCIFYSKKLYHIAKLWNTLWFIAVSTHVIRHLALLFSFMHFNEITPHTCPNVTLFQLQFISAKILRIPSRTKRIYLQEGTESCSCADLSLIVFHL